MKKPPNNGRRIPMEKRAEMAFKEAVSDVVEEHARLKLPLHVWRDGKVVELSPKELRSPAKNSHRK